MEKLFALLGPYASTVFPLAVTYLAWGIVSGAYLLVYDHKLPHSDADWAAAFAKAPKLAALNSLVKTLGWNIPGGLRALRIFFGGPLPEPIRKIVAASSSPQAAVASAAKELVSEAVDAAEKGAKQ